MIPRSRLGIFVFVPVSDSVSRHRYCGDLLLLGHGVHIEPRVLSLTGRFLPCQYSILLYCFALKGRTISIVVKQASERGSQLRYLCVG